jgi:hypothetical protein
VPVSARRVYTPVIEKAEVIELTPIEDEAKYIDGLGRLVGRAP